MKWIAVVLVCVAGCVPTNEDMLKFSGDVDKLMTEIDDKQEKVIKEVDRVQGQVAVVNEAMKIAEGMPAKIQAGIEASKPFNPYADLMSAVFGIVTAGSLIVARIKGQKASEAEAKRQADKIGREKTLREIAAMGSEVINTAVLDAKMYANIGNARAQLGVK